MALLILFLGGITGLVLDLAGVKSPPLYMTIGWLTGFLMMLC